MTKNNKRVMTSKKKKSKPSRARGSGSKAYRGTSKMAAMVAYDTMIRDPCGAPPARAPYTGTESGYTARTVEQWVPYADLPGTAGATGVIDVAIAIIPRTYLGDSSGPMVGGSSTGGTMTLNSWGPPNTNFVKGAARRWRPLACCLKWVPSGANEKRAGVVGMGYSSSSSLIYGQTATASTMSPLTMERAPNGAIAHEIRWLPGAIDENYISGTMDTEDATGAQVFAVLQGVDATWGTTARVFANGFFEVTIIWEWVPPSGGISVTPVAPPPFSINEHQSTIGNIGNFLLKGVRTLANNSYVQAAGSRLLTAGYQAVTRSLPAIGMLAL